MKQYSKRAPQPWQMIQGDSLVVLRDMPSASVDAVLVDPPYSSGGTFGRERAKADANAKYQNCETQRRYPKLLGDTRDARGYLAWCALWLAECWRVAKDGAVVAVFADWRQLPTITDAIQAGGWIWRGVMPWDKGHARPQMGRPTQQAEFIAWGSRGALPADRGVGVLPGCHRIPIRASEKQHVTAKPVALMRELAKLAPPNAVILDPFAGSGSTGCGALLEGRRFVGVEMNPDYVDIATRRLADAEAEHAAASAAGRRAA
jgi:site-specific DNA-methyltransferase (adenine-specific)